MLPEACPGPLYPLCITMRTTPRPRPRPLFLGRSKLGPWKIAKFGGCRANVRTRQRYTAIEHIYARGLAVKSERNSVNIEFEYLKIPGTGLVPVSGSGFLIWRQFWSGGSHQRVLMVLKTDTGTRTDTGIYCVVFKQATEKENCHLETMPRPAFRQADRMS